LDTVDTAGGDIAAANRANIRAVNRRNRGAIGSAMDAGELMTVCRRAAAFTCRSPRYSPDERSDCAADIAGDIIAKTAAKYGATAACMPMASDPIVRFSHVVNLAKNWRRRRIRERRELALATGADNVAAGATRDKYATDDLPADYLHAAGVQSVAAAIAATAKLCEALSLPAHAARGGLSDAGCALYLFVRDCDGDTAATELGITRQAFYDRRLRGARLIAGDTATYSAMIAGEHAGRSSALGSYVKVLSTLAGRPAAHAGIPARNRAGRLSPEWCGEWRTPHDIFALADDSRPAHGRTPILAGAERNNRDGTLSFIGDDGVPVNAHPVIADDRREPADRDYADDAAMDAIAGATVRLGRALAGSRGRMPRTAHGATAGTPPAKYAPRAVRLGPTAG
jgi:hypothetical protein